MFGEAGRRRRQNISILVGMSHPNTGDTAGLRAPRPVFAYETGKRTPPLRISTKTSYNELSVYVRFML